MKKVYDVVLDVVEGCGGFTGLINIRGVDYTVQGSWDISKIDRKNNYFETSVGDISLRLKSGKLSKVLNDDRFDIHTLSNAIESVLHASNYLGIRLQEQREHDADLSQDR